MKEIDMKVYEELLAAVKAPAQMTNAELISKLQKGISDIYKVLNYVPSEQDREYIYSCLEGIHEIINDLAMDGDVLRTEYLVDEE